METENYGDPDYLTDFYPKESQEEAEDSGKSYDPLSIYPPAKTEFFPGQLREAGNPLYNIG